MWEQEYRCLLLWGIDAAFFRRGNRSPRALHRTVEPLRAGSMLLNSAMPVWCTPDERRRSASFFWKRRKLKGVNSRTYTLFATTSTTHMVHVYVCMYRWCISTSFPALLSCQMRHVPRDVNLSPRRVWLVGLPFPSITVLPSIYFHNLGITFWLVRQKQLSPQG